MITKLLILIEFNYGDVFFSAPICSATVGYGPNFERPNVFHATNVTQESSGLSGKRKRPLLDFRSNLPILIKVISKHFSFLPPS